MVYSLEGKSAIVTGAGGGINLAFAIKLLEGGVNVLIADLTLRPESEKVVSQYTGTPKAVFHKTDVTSWKELKSMFETAQQTFGPVDIVCPGAGVFEPPFSNFWHPPGSLESKDDPLGSSYKTLDLNLTHPIRVTQMAISHFLAGTPKSSPQSPKRIIHIASVAAEVASLTFPLYHASKWGLAGFIRSMANLDEKFGIRVAGVAPGIVKTPLWTDNKEKMRMVTDKEGTVQSSWITPEQVAEQMLALVTEDEIVNSKGETLQVKGGFMLEIAAGDKAVREIPMFNNPGPPRDAQGMSMIAGEVGMDELMAELAKPGWGKF